MATCIYHNALALYQVAAATNDHRSCRCEQRVSLPLGLSTSHDKCTLNYIAFAQVAAD